MFSSASDKIEVLESCITRLININQKFEFGVNHTAVGPGTDSNFRAFKVSGAKDADGTLPCGSSAYEKLYGYFLDGGEMPYLVAKARTGDPDFWIIDYLETNESR